MKVYAPGTEIGQYRVLSDPLMGGMGVVYICHDLTHDRPVALKTFKPEYLPDRAARDRFLREGTAWVELGRHPHIVRCYEVQYIDPTAFLALELVVKDEGRADASLRSWLGQPLPLETALAFTLQIARGLAHAAHQIPGFVHRDLKPENVLVGQDTLPDTAVNRLRVTDFGLVAILADEGGRLQDEEGPELLGRTHLTRGLMGTPLYMAPEQWTGGPLGVYTDVYALGCILYEMLTGERVVSGRSLTALQTAHCQGHLRPMPPALPGAVTGFLTRCLARERGARYADWAGVLAALEMACAGQGVALPAPQAEATSRAEQRDLASSYLAMGSSYLHLGNARVAAGYYEKALGILRAIGDRQGEGAALGNLGTAYAHLGDARRAIGYYEEDLKIAREIGDRRGEGNALNNLGPAYRDLGDARRAIGYYEEALKIAREIGDRSGEGTALGNLGLAYADLGDAWRAIGYHEECLKLHRAIGDRRGVGNALGNLGTAYAHLGDARRAIGYFEAQLTIVHEIGDRSGEGTALGNLGAAYRDLGDARRAIGYCEEALKIAREIGDRRGEGNALGNLGNAYYSLGDVRRAVELTRQALQISRETGDVVTAGMLGANLGMSLAQAGNVNEAIPLLQQAIQDFYQAGYPHLAPKAEQFLAQLQSGVRPAPAAADPAQAAFEAFQRAGSAQEMQAALAAHPMLKAPQFHAAIAQVIREQVPDEAKPAFEQRLAWLKQITKA